MAKVTLDRETFKALASETRLDLLRSLDERRKTGSELARDLKLNKATVHEHLQLLDSVGLVKKVDEGRKWIYYELSWQGRKLLHPEQGATFSVLLGLSIVSAGGAFAMLGRAFDWWLAGRSSDDGADGLGDFDGGPQAASDDANGTQETAEWDRITAAPDEPAMDGDGFWDDGGMLSLVMFGLMALFLVLAAALRFRASGKS